MCDIIYLNKAQTFARAYQQPNVSLLHYDICHEVSHKKHLLIILGRCLQNNSLKFPQDEVLDVNYHLDGEDEAWKCPNYMVGDEIFGLKLYLMRPYPGQRNARLPQDEAVFNYRLSRTRRVIENAFGILVARWRLFKSPIRASAEH